MVHYMVFGYLPLSAIKAVHQTIIKSIEVQLMQRFLQDSELISMSLPEEFADELKPLFPSLPTESATGSLRETFMPECCTTTLGTPYQKWTLDTPTLTLNFQTNILKQFSMNSILILSSSCTASSIKFQSRRLSWVVSV